MAGVSPLLRVLGFAAGVMPRRVALGVYGVPVLARLLRALLNALVPVGLQEVTVVSGPLRGARLLLDLKYEKYLWLGTYEPWVHEGIQRHLRLGMAAWDVGAFIGYHTLLMRGVAGSGRVVALESDPINRARLEQNLTLNGARDVAALPAAAGREPGVATLERIAGAPSQTRVFSSAGGVGKVIRLDNLLERFPPPRLVKIDAEGAEAEILAGARRLLEEFRPVWIMELHGIEGQRAADHLCTVGYKLRRIGKGVDVNPEFPVGGPSHLIALP